MAADRQRQRRGVGRVVNGHQTMSKPLCALPTFIYTDLWWWIGQESEIPDRQKAFMPDYQVNEELLALAPPHAKFMHCLPASRGVEVTDAVMDGPQSIIYDQSENRLHSEKGTVGAFRLPKAATAVG